MAQPVSTINVVEQLGFETTAGSGGSAGTRLQSLMIEAGDELTTKEYTSQGYRYPSLVATEMAWTSLALSGEALYTECLLPIENLMGSVTPVLNGTLTYSRTYDLPPTGSVTPHTWTGQFGDASDNVNTWAYGLCTDYGEKWDREQGVSMSGAGIAQIIATGGSFTAAPTYMAKIPILGSETNYYLDTTGAGLGTTQITDEILSCEWSIKGVKGPRWVSDRAQPSFKGHVDLLPKTEVKLMLAEDSVTRTIISNLKNGQTYFLRIDGQGPLIETVAGTPSTNYYYTAQRDIAFQVNKIAKYSDAKGVYAREVSGTIVYDSTWGHALMVNSQTTEATL